MAMEMAEIKAVVESEFFVPLEGLRIAWIESMNPR
jgi:hypothetical protein